MASIDDIFKNVCPIGSYDSHNAYLMGLIRQVEVKRKHTNAEVSRRHSNLLFSVRVRGKHFQVCCQGSPTGTPIPDNQWMCNNHPEEDTVTERIYRTVFTRDYNIVFAPPKTDVCATCERLKNVIRAQCDQGTDVSEVEAEMAEE
ncbi:hypothetical protein Pcinc_022194 [Petrolisthes cinctipes]|uniref:Uncharacterized protein n=1 Tax=Petrolisthes cinctipes TaxID=88211 RepID=A0AAE1KHF4_PETCI|nr:hypothetical protein Pcinc_022194 [Petrolisthes cinctipes]